MKFTDTNIQEALSSEICQHSRNTSFKRLFYIKDVPENGHRGGHAHKECIQYLFVLKGEVTINTLERGGGKHVLLLKAGESLLVNIGVWLDLYFHNNAILGVYCTHTYSESDYIRNIKDFLTNEG